MSGGDLDILDPAPGVVQFRGERLEIRPLTIGMLPAFSRLVRPIIAEFHGGKHPAWNADDNAMVIDLLEGHGEDLITALSIAARKPVKFIAGGAASKPRWWPRLAWALACRLVPPLRPATPAELIDLARVAVGVNRDFFTLALRSLIAAQAEARAPGSTHGQTPSSTSSRPAIR